jgi:sulfur-oxidizing protein SoxY
MHTRFLTQEFGVKTRRDMLSHSAAVAALLASAGLFPRLASAQDAAASAYKGSAFDSKTVPDALKALGIAAPTESKDVTVTAPDIAENGAVVPVGASTSLPGVKKLLLAVPNNPAPLSAVFEVSDAVEANFSTRVKMGQSSDVYAIALMADGTALFAKKEVKVTMGGCGG